MKWSETLNIKQHVFHETLTASEYATLSLHFPDSPSLPFRLQCLIRKHNFHQCQSLDSLFPASLSLAANLQSWLPLFSHFFNDHPSLVSVSSPSFLYSPISSLITLLWFLFPHPPSPPPSFSSFHLLFLLLTFMRFTYHGARPALYSLSNAQLKLFSFHIFSSLSRFVNFLYFQRFWWSKRSSLYLNIYPVSATHTYIYIYMFIVYTDGNHKN